MVTFSVTYENNIADRVILTDKPEKLAQRDIRTRGFEIIHQFGSYKTFQIIHINWIAILLVIVGVPVFQ